jgi:glycosyltransferase involved in cell wall biosynthesis
MHSLASFSALATELVPDAKTMETMGAADLSLIYNSLLRTTPSKSVKSVHSHVFPWFINWCIAQRKNIPVWVHTHHLWYYDEHRAHQQIPWHVEFNHFFLEALKSCDVPLCVSRWQQAFLLREHGVRTHYLPNGVDVSLCLRGVARNFHKTFAIPEDFVLWVGRNDPVKNPAEMVQLAAALPDIAFCMAGPGLSPESLLADYGVVVPPNVRFTGKLTQAGVQDAIAACRVLVVTSRREGLPTLVLEGLAHQKPMVVPNEDGCTEALGGAQFGAVYTLGDVPSLTSALRVCFEAPRQNAFALERVRDEFDWPVIMRKLDKVYNGGLFE